MIQLRLTMHEAIRHLHMQDTAPCRYCGRAFSKRVDHHIYCSTRCRQKAYRQRKKDGIVRYEGIAVAGEPVAYK